MPTASLGIGLLLSVTGILSFRAMHSPTTAAWWRLIVSVGAAVITVMIGVLLLIHTSSISTVGLGPDTRLGAILTVGAVTAGRGFWACLLGLLILLISSILLALHSRSSMQTAY